MENKEKTIYEELIDLQDLIKKESSLSINLIKWQLNYTENNGVKELCKSFFIYQSK